MTPLKDAPRGARFVRADLHIHSYGGSYDVPDTGMTPVAIVDAAVDQGLGVIAITDHNSITNVAAALAAAQGKPLLVVPGVELSTPGGHILVYTETFDALTRLMARLQFNDDHTACRTSVPARALRGRSARSWLGDREDGAHATLADDRPAAGNQRAMTNAARSAKLAADVPFRSPLKERERERPSDRRRGGWCRL